MAFSGEILDLAEQAYQAVSVPSAWSVLLQSLADTLQCGHVLLFWGAVDEGRLIASGLDKSDLERFAVPEFIRLGKQAYYDKLPENHVVSSSSFISDWDMERTTFYNEVIRPANGFRAASLACRRDAPFVLAACRERKADPFEERELTLLQALQPHLSSAIEMANRFKVVEDTARGLAGLLECSSEGVVLLDGGGAPVFANRRAETILAKSRALMLRPCGLVAADPATDIKLHKAIKAAAKGDARSMPVQFSLSAQSAMSIRIVSVGSPGFFLFGEARARVAVFLNEPDTDGVLNRAALRDVFHLTERECDVATLLAAGESLRVIAERFQLSRWTVRHYLKIIFEKTETNSQVALVALLRSTPLTVPLSR